MSDSCFCTARRERWLSSLYYMTSDPHFRVSSQTVSLENRHRPQLTILLEATVNFLNLNYLFPIIFWAPHMPTWGVLVEDYKAAQQLPLYTHSLFHKHWLSLHPRWSLSNPQRLSNLTRLRGAIILLQNRTATVLVTKSDGNLSIATNRFSEVIVSNLPS